MRDCVSCIIGLFWERVLTRMLLKRGTESRERARGTGNRKMGTKQRIGNEVTEGPGFNLGFVLIFPFPVLVFRLRNIPFLACMFCFFSKFRPSDVL